MKTGKGKISKKKSGNRGYDSYWVYLPSKIAKDIDFPFRDKEEVIVELKGEHIEIRRIYDLSEITKSYAIEDATIPKVIESKALLNKDKTLIYYQDKSYSYQKTNEISNQIAHGLIKVIKKLKLKNPNISALLPDCPDFLFCWFGVAKTGSVFVPVSYIFDKDTIEFIFRNSNAEILIIDHLYYEKIKDIFRHLPKLKKIFLRNASKDYEFDERCSDFKELFSDNIENPNVNINSLHPLEICYTSATTGKPKGVLYRNYYSLSGISVGRPLEDLGFGTKINKIYCPLPLFQGLERYFLILPMIFYNGSIIIAENFDISTFWDDLEKYEADAFGYYGAILTALVNQAPSSMDRKHSIKYAIGAGAGKKIWEIFERRFGIPLIEMWALVEAIGFTVNSAGSKGGKLGSVGKPARGVQIKIVDAEDNTLPPGRDNVGEICARTKLPFELEYYNLQEETVTRKGEDRWIYTGDFGYMDNEGYLYYLGRKSDMIQRGEDVFFAIDVEIVANSHPLILESAVFEVNGHDNDKKELKICAVSHNGSLITPKDFQTFLMKNLAYFMVPRYIEFRESLPKNPNELIQKFILKYEWETGKSLKNTFDVRGEN